MKYRILSTCLCCYLFFSESTFAQQAAEKEEVFYPHHGIALMPGHVHVFEGRDEEGNKKVLSMPSWAVDYNYFFHPKWAIGLHTDIIIEKFEVESYGGETIERSYPVAPAFMGIYKPTDHWSFLLGMGAEFAEEGNFALTRAGIEYSGELPKDWEVFGSLSYDYKWNGYDTWGIGIGIAKLFGKRKQDKR
jgi:hypothetical protein